jgi:iron complex transport system ATP-binding protein
MLELDDVGFSYRPGSWVFRHFSAAVDGGKVLALLGPNGRGKSTLLRCGAGLADPQEGAVHASGAVGFVPQLHAASVAYRTIDMVLMGRTRHLRAYSSPSRNDRIAALSALDRVGMAGFANRGFSTLSGGERQLVVVARAIAAECEILVLDEPVSALDLRNQGQVLTLLRELADEGMAVLVSIHHPDHALYVADEVAVMFGTEDARVGPTVALLTDEILADLYGVRVRTVAFCDGGEALRAITTRYAP